MKTSLPKNNTEIVTCIMSLIDEMAHLKDDVKECKSAISDHADEARISNKNTNDTIKDLQFSVTGIQNNMLAMQDAIRRLTELSSSLVTIGHFIVKIAKTLAWGTALSVAVITIIQYIK